MCYSLCFYFSTIRNVVEFTIEAEFGHAKIVLMCYTLYFMCYTAILIETSALHFLLLHFVSCKRPCLTVFTEYTNREFLQIK